MEPKVCSATKKRIDNDRGAAIFLCPKCSKHEIVRSSNARRNAVKYNCPGCGFTGPN